MNHRLLKCAKDILRYHYGKALKSLGTYKERLAPAMKKYPVQGPRNAFGTYSRSRKQNISQLKVEKMKELNAIANKSRSNQREPGAQDRWKALKHDCFLYAQDDQYK